MIGNIFGKFFPIVSPVLPNSIPTFTLSFKNICLNYAKVGTGPPLVLIHGWTNNWEGWIPLVPYLQDDYTLYLVDMPGFGDSSEIPVYTIETVSFALYEFLKALQLKPYAVVGLSMGSFVAAYMAYLYPESINSVVLIGPVIKNGGSIGKGVKLILQTIHRSRLSETVLKKIVETRILAYLVSKYINMYAFRRELIDLYGMVGKKKMRKEAFVQMGISAAQFPMEKIVQSIRISTLLIYGREDKINKPDYARTTVMAKNPLIALSVIPFAGHVVPWEKPEDVAESIKRFIKK